MPNTILSVEDDPQSLYIIQHLLEKKGFTVYTAKNGSDAISLLLDQKILPDLIISDISMPEMNGYDFYIAVSKNSDWNSIPFIFLSGRSDLEDIRFAKKLGVDDYIVKPFHIQDLLASVEGKLAKSLRNKQLSSEIESRLSTSQKLEFLNVDNPSFNKSIESNFDCIWYIEWDKNFKPKIFNTYPNIDEIPFLLTGFEDQISSIVETLVSSNNPIETHEVLINLSQFNRMCYITFNWDQEIYYSLGVVAPNIHYLAYLRIQEIMLNLIECTESRMNFNLSEIGERVKFLLSYNERKIQEVWIFYEGGVELVNYAPNTILSSELFIGFITAMQNFAHEISHEECKMFRFGDSQYFIYHEVERPFYIIGKSDKFSPEKIVNAILKNIYNAFWKEFQPYLKNFTGEVTFFHAFEQKLKEFIQ